jgi:hypothetical protein
MVLNKVKYIMAESIKFPANLSEIFTQFLKYQAICLGSDTSLQRGTNGQTVRYKADMTFENFSAL